jgi:hypothetical protein
MVGAGKAQLQSYNRCAVGGVGWIYPSVVFGAALFPKTTGWNIFDVGMVEAETSAMIGGFCRPCGTLPAFRSNPASKRWAIVGRPCGTFAGKEVECREGGKN